jgi:WD40 repeat protein
MVEVTICLIGWLCRTRYVRWLFSVAIFVILFAATRQLCPFFPRITIPASLELHAISPDGSILAISEGSGRFPYYGPIQLWNLKTGERQLSIVGGWTAVRKVEFSPLGSMLAILDEADRLTIWKTATGSEVARFTELEHKVRLPLETLFSPDERFLVIQEPREGWPRTDFLIFWDIKTKAVHARLEGELHYLTFARDGKEMAQFVRPERKQYSVEKWQLDAKFPASGPVCTHDVAAPDVAFSPKFDFFASRRPGTVAGEEVVQLWDLTTGEEKAKVVYSNPDSSNYHLQFSPNGRFLSVDNPGRFGWMRAKRFSPLLWDTEAGLREVGANLDVLRVSPDDRWLLALEKGPHNIALYETATFKECGVVSMPNEGFISSASGQTVSPTYWDLYQFTPDSKFVLVTGQTVFGTGNAAIDFIEGFLPAFLQMHMWHMVRLWDVETAEQIASFGGCTHALYSSDAKILVTAHEDGTTKIWDMPPRKPVVAILGVSLVLWLVLILAVRLARKMIVRRSGLRNPV